MDQDHRDHLQALVGRGDRLKAVLDHDQFQALAKECLQVWEAQCLDLDPLDPDLGRKALYLRAKVEALREFLRGLESSHFQAEEARLEMQGLLADQDRPVIL
jgi:hypothetical protein